jgi:hypothetical protein
MPNSKNWTPEKAREYYEENKERLRIEKRRRYINKKKERRQNKVSLDERVYN